MTSDNRVETREDLLYLLSQASELEHSLACQYLFTAFSLKDSVEEGVSQAQLSKIDRWRKTINEIAVQEMLHLAIASNLLTAIGGVTLPRKSGHSRRVDNRGECSNDTKTTQDLYRRAEG
jgi:Ferritin-like